DVDHAVVDGEDLLGVVVLAVGLLALFRGGQVGVEVRQVLAVEQVDGAVALVSRGAGTGKEGQQAEQQWANADAERAKHYGIPFVERDPQVGGRLASRRDYSVSPLPTP